MERIRVKVQGASDYNGRLAHIVAYRQAGDVLVVLDTGEIFATAAVNLLAVDNAWQQQDGAAEAEANARAGEAARSVGKAFKTVFGAGAQPDA